MFCVKCFKKPRQEIDLQEVPKKLQQIGSFKTETNVPNPMNQETDEKQNNEVEL